MALVIFDFDGTLVDTAPAFAAAWRQVAVELGADAPPVSETRGIVAGALRYESIFRRQAERAVAGPVDRPVDAAARRLEEVFREVYPTYGKLYPGVYRLLMALDERAGCGIAGSCARPQLTEMLDYFGLDGYVAHIYSMMDLVEGERSVDEVVAGWCQQARTPREEAVWVSSRPDQLEIARRVGLQTAFAAYGYGTEPEWAPDHRIERLSGLLRLFPRHL